MRLCWAWSGNLVQAQVGFWHDCTHTSVHNHVPVYTLSTQHVVPSSGHNHCEHCSFLLLLDFPGKSSSKACNTCPVQEDASILMPSCNVCDLLGMSTLSFRHSGISMHCLLQCRSLCRHGQPRRNGTAPGIAPISRHGWNSGQLMVDAKCYASPCIIYIAASKDVPNMLYVDKHRLTTHCLTYFGCSVACLIAK